MCPTSILGRSARGWMRWTRTTSSRLTCPAAEHELSGPHTEEPSWLLPRARVHDHVLTAWTMVASVVPYRFGAVFDGAEGVRQHLRTNAEALRRTLGVIGDGVEYEVRIRVATEVAWTVGHRGGGRDYLRARGRQLAGGGLQDAHRRVEGMLLRCGARTVPLVTGAGEVRLAFLVPRARACQAVDALESDAGDGVAVEVTGPHPAYRFAGPAERVRHEPAPGQAPDAPGSGRHRRSRRRHRRRGPRRCHARRGRRPLDPAGAATRDRLGGPARR